jgi:hypothetical protein
MTALGGRQPVTTSFTAGFTPAGVINALTLVANVVRLMPPFQRCGRKCLAHCRLCRQRRLAVLYHCTYARAATGGTAPLPHADLQLGMPMVVQHFGQDAGYGSGGSVTPTSLNAYDIKGAHLSAKTLLTPTPMNSIMRAPGEFQGVGDSSAFCCVLGKRTVIVCSAGPFFMPVYCGDAPDCVQRRFNNWLFSTTSGGAPRFLLRSTVLVEFVLCSSSSAFWRCDVRTASLAFPRCVLSPICAFP